MPLDNLPTSLRALPQSAPRDAYLRFLNSVGDAALRRNGGPEHVCHRDSNSSELDHRISNLVRVYGCPSSLQPRENGSCGVSGIGAPAKNRLFRLQVPLKVSRSTIAAQSLGSVKALVQTLDVPGTKTCPAKSGMRTAGKDAAATALSSVVCVQLNCSALPGLAFRSQRKNAKLPLPITVMAVPFVFSATYLHGVSK